MKTASGWIDGETLRVKAWDPKCRPTMRSIREWERKGLLPSVRIGRLVFFDLEEVRRALAAKR
jgi:hypothetical protein